MTLAAADLAGRTGEILGRFPSFMLAPSPPKALTSVAAALGSSLDEDERLGTEIQRAHRLPVAGEAGDVLALAALLTLHPADFFILGGLHAHGLFADAVVDPVSEQDREQRGYDAYVAALRDGVRRAVAVLMDGCGTLWALLEGTAVLLDATQLEGRSIEHLDDFVHRVSVRHHVDPGTADGFIYLVENPINEHDGGDLPRACRETFPIKRGGFFDGTVAIQVTGVGKRTVHPMIVNRTTHEGVGWAGVVGDGQKLVFTTEGTVLLDGLDVTAQAYHFRGALADGSPFDGDPPLDVAVVVEPPGALARAFPRPHLTPPATQAVARLMLGDSLWRFSVEEGAFDGSTFDGAVFALPADTSGSAPSGRLQLSWEENEPFAVTVLIPAELQTLQDAGLVDGNLPTLVRAGLERFRTAGIKLDVRYFDADSILGHSVLEDLGAPPGSGVDFDATIPSPIEEPSA